MENHSNSLQLVVVVPLPASGGLVVPRAFMPFLATLPY